jgi:hypothetical protein
MVREHLTVLLATEPRELDGRTRDGIYVTGAALELELGHGQRALDVYHHRYAYAARHVHSMTDGGSRACDPTAAAERLEPEIIGDQSGVREDVSLRRKRVRECHG